MGVLLLAALLGMTAEEQIDGSEIGDATQFVGFNSGGKYVAQRADAKAGKTVAHGTWKMKESELEVKVASCKGPACAQVGKGYKAQIQMAAERAMLVASTPPDSPLSSGSYYCHYQGCEKRTGVLLQTQGAPPAVMRYLVDFLIDKNTRRNVTVVWWGPKVEGARASTTVSYCQRDAERAKKGAEQLAADLAELSWMGKVELKGTSTDCLHDVMLTVGDGVRLPPRNGPAAP